MTAFDVLRAAYGEEIATRTCDAYKEVETHYALGKWKTSELDAGHFVEAVRRLLEKQFTGAYTAFGTGLPNFNDTVLKSYENRPGQHESYRILIPRTLWAIFGIRNKRGVGHVGEVSPNRMDSTYLLHGAKWVLGEIVRLNSKAPIDVTESLVKAIAERRVDGIWKIGATKIVLDCSLNTVDQILLLLLDESPCPVVKLLQHTSYKNTSRFNQILAGMRDKRLIWIESGVCHLLPAGLARAEKTLVEGGKV